MNKEDNPYLNFLQIMQNQAPQTPSPFYIGEVINETPLQVKVNEIVFNREEMLINSELLKGYRRKVKINAKSVKGTVIPEGNLSTFYMDYGDIETIEDYLKQGDKVLVFTQDQQTLILVCKVE